MQFNGGATGGLLFPLQHLMAVLRAARPDQRLDLPEARRHHRHPVQPEAAQHLQQWIKAGYFNEDVNAIDYADDDEPVHHGEGLFMFDGDWESGNLDKQMPGKVGFFLMPPLKAGGKHAAMSAPLTFGIAAKAKHADCAAFFLNWVATNQTAREHRREVGGSHPMGPPSLHAGSKPGTVTAQTLAAGQGSARTTARWTSSPTRRAPSTPRAGRRRCRSSSPASRRRRSC